MPIAHAILLEAHIMIPLWYSRALKLYNNILQCKYIFENAKSFKSNKACLLHTAITTTDDLAMTTTVTESQATTVTTLHPNTTFKSQNTSSNPPMFSVSTYVAIPVVIGIGIQLLLTGVVIFVLARKLRRKSKLKDNVAVRVKYVPGQSGGSHHLNNPGPEDNANCGFDNQVVSTMLYNIMKAL